MLTNDQKKVLDAVFDLIVSDTQEGLIIEGFAGCGKSYVISEVLNQLPNYINTLKLIAPDFKEPHLELAATTNKAAEHLSRVTNQEVRTLHSILGLTIVDRKLVPKWNIRTYTNSLFIIDEVSRMDSQLIKYLYQYTKNCKYIFIGDPAQTTPVGYNSCPAFNLPYPKVKLTEVVRQKKGSPIADLAKKFRESVVSGQRFKFKPDQETVIHLPREDFDKEIKNSFNESCKFLAWTNQRVIDYNKLISEHQTGDPHLSEGDYAIVNSFIGKGASALRTDQTVLIKLIIPGKRAGLTGNSYILANSHGYFMPNSNKEKKELLNKHKGSENLISWNICNEIETWIDLRAQHACTIDKSQGSTYDRVFIDLDDIAKCNVPSQVARMCYVAVSRARHKVYLTGDLK
jgi:hypothetical protein